MDNRDKSLMYLLRWMDEYIRGVNDFLDKASERASQGNEILCPCKKYINRYWHYRNVVEDHLVVNELVNGYTKWVFHGEGFSSRNAPHQSNDDKGKWEILDHLQVLLMRYAAKLEEMEERMQQRLMEKFNVQKDAMELQVAVNIISQLKRLNQDLRVDTNMLTFNARSPGEASSAQQTAMQLINRLSTSDSYLQKK